MVGNADFVWSATYWSQFRKHSHMLLLWGYQDARHQIGSDDEEDDITGCIVTAIKQRLRQFHTPRWLKQYFVAENEPQPDAIRTGKRRRRTDIRIERNGKGRPEYIFEAKRLHYPKHRREQDYIHEGLQRFISGQYALRYPEAAMLGYIQTDDSVIWQQKIKAAIDTEGHALGLRSRQKDELVLEIFSCEWKSTHQRNNDTVIVIYHILIDCTSVN